jgi:glycerophosphoryl diester phosphodiesterase
MDFGKKDFFVIAHRGASAYEPENTLRSFRRAVDMGADIVELDVRLSRDGALVVIHDETLDRTTNGCGAVRDKTLAELRSLDAGLGERVPTLDEVVSEVGDKVALAIEIKERGAEEGVVEVIRSRSLLCRAFVISFDEGVLVRVRELEPRITTGFLYFYTLRPVRRALGCGASLLCPNHRFVTSRLIREAEKASLHVVTWTVDDPKRGEALRRMGVRAIATNKPDIFCVHKSPSF